MLSLLFYLYIFDVLMTIIFIFPNIRYNTGPTWLLLYFWHYSYFVSWLMQQQHQRTDSLDKAGCKTTDKCVYSCSAFHLTSIWLTFNHLLHTISSSHHPPASVKAEYHKCGVHLYHIAPRRFHQPTGTLSSYMNSNASKKVEKDLRLNIHPLKRS